MSLRAGLAALYADRIALLRLLPRAGFPAVAALSVVRAAAALIPSATALAAGVLVRELTTAQRSGAGFGPVVWPLVVIGAVLIVGQALDSLRNVTDELVAGRIDGSLRADLRGLATAPATIDHLIDPRFRDRMARAVDFGGRERHRSPGTAVAGQVRLIFRMFGALAATAVLATFSVPLAVALLAASLLIRARVRRQWLHLAMHYDSHAGRRRRVDYWSELAGGDAAAKEVRLFGLADWLIGRRQQEASVAYGEVWQRRRGVVRSQPWTVVLAAGSALAALLVPGLAALDGRVGSDLLVTSLVAAWGIFKISAMGHEAFDIEYGLGAVRAYRSLLADRPAPTLAAPAVPAAPAAPAVPAVPAVPAAPAEVRFEGVGFRYPGVERPVLDGLDLVIRPGEVLALVGINGAGKTTLAKLLAGLHRPAYGRITVDGAELRAADLEAWRRRVVPVFQDFVHYPATVRDNVAFSAPEHPVTDDAVRAAAVAAGAAEFVERLPQGLDTPLWRAGTGGVDLSGGQWQRLAIARALYAVAHGRTVVVLDEPTAHLDVRAEASFYEQVLAAVHEVSVVLISHRLSTVRRADRIAVLSGCRVTEEGSHVELMARGGEYARLFELQASRFHAGAVRGA